MTRVCSLALFVGAAYALFAPSFACTQATAGMGQRAGADPIRLDAQARKVLDAGLKSNGLADPAIKPWHAKVDFQEALNLVDGRKMFGGSMEEWSAGPYRWHRAYNSERENWNGSEWSLSKVERYAKSQRHQALDDYSLMFRIARPLTDPLFQIANIKPTDQLAIRRVDASDMSLNCISLSPKSASERGKKPGWMVPTMCFDDDSHLRVIRSEETILEFNDIQLFEGKAVARDVRISDSGHLSAEIKVNLLEEMDGSNDEILKPPADAVFRPYVVERGSPKPVSVYEEGAHISHMPSLPNGMPAFTSLLVPVFIQKDGTVKLQRGVSDVGTLQGVFEAVYKAVRKWKFKPYLVDGQPVEVDYYLPYEITDPYVPSYQKNPSPADDVAGGHPGI
jgi:hypothetical protein